jgi:hypothetical protein
MARKPTKTRPEITYLIEAVGLEMVKIGKTTNIETRLGCLRSACPVEVRLLGVCSVAEDAAHSEFNHLRVRGEWFRLTKEIRSFIKAECKTALGVLQAVPQDRSRIVPSGPDDC